MPGAPEHIPLRRVQWVRLVLADEGMHAEVFGVAHRHPVQRRVPLSVATELSAAGVPVVVRDERSPDAETTAAGA